MLRTLSFEGILNSRDLGGLVTADGNTIRKGLLLRTANLSQASNADLLRLQEEVRLSLVLDLRTASERTGSPDQCLMWVAAAICLIAFAIQASEGDLTTDDNVSGGCWEPDLGHRDLGDRGC